MSQPVPRIPISERYSTLLTRLAEAGYEARSFDDFDAGSRHVILRHDIDACPLRALRMARDEATMGWGGVYFVQLTSAFYNPFAPNVRAALNTIAELGHEVGVHLEVLPNSTRESLERDAEEQARILSGLLGGRAVRWMSFHRPGANAAALADFIETPVFGGLNNAYARAYGEAAGLAYRSDSGGKWYATHPLDHPRVREGRALQLLTHPVWWYGDEPQNSVETARSFCDEHDTSFRSEVVEQFLQRAGRPDLSRR